jgi:hypothetical protein
MAILQRFRDTSRDNRAMTFLFKIEEVFPLFTCRKILTSHRSAEHPAALTVLDSMMTTRMRPVRHFL